MARVIAWSSEVVTFYNLAVPQVVSNRLPVTLYPDRAPPNDVEQHLRCLVAFPRLPRSSGGLASALRSCVEGYEEVY